MVNTEKKYAVATFDTGMPKIEIAPSYSTWEAAMDQLRMMVRNTLIRVCHMQAKAADAAAEHALTHPYERGICEINKETGIAKVYYSVRNKPEMIWLQVVEL